MTEREDSSTGELSSQDKSDEKISEVFSRNNPTKFFIRVISIMIALLSTMSICYSWYQRNILPAQQSLELKTTNEPCPNSIVDSFEYKAANYHFAIIMGIIFLVLAIISLVLTYIVDNKTTLIILGVVLLLVIPPAALFAKNVSAAKGHTLLQVVCSHG